VTRRRAVLVAGVLLASALSRSLAEEPKQKLFEIASQRHKRTTAVFTIPGRKPDE